MHDVPYFGVTVCLRVQSVRLLLNKLKILFMLYLDFFSTCQKTILTVQVRTIRTIPGILLPGAPLLASLQKYRYSS